MPSMFEPDAIGALDAERFDRQFAVNLRAPLFLSEAFAAQAGERASIVNILDQRVFKLTPHFVSYTLAKSALHSATRMLAQALAPKVRVNAVAPGPTMASARQAAGGFRATGGRGAARPRTDARRRSPRRWSIWRGARSVTGVTLAVDGGQHLAWQTPDTRRRRMSGPAVRRRRFRQRSAAADHRRGRRRPLRGACRERGRGRAGGDRARRGAVRVDRAVGRAHPGGRHALPARARHRGFGRSSSPRTSRARRMARRTRSWCARSRRSAGPTVEWLADTYAMPFEVITDFNYPGHSAHRMHGLPSRTGAELIDRLRSAVGGARDPDPDRAASARRCSPTRTASSKASRSPGGETIGCGALVLACNGYGGNPELVRRHIPEMGDALYFGHPGNQGDAVLWGEALGARLRALSRLSGPRLGRDAAQHPDHLGGDHGGRLSGERAGPPLLTTRRSAIRKRPRKCCASRAASRSISSMRASPAWRGSSRISGMPRRRAR